MLLIVADLLKEKVKALDGGSIVTFIADGQQRPDGLPVFSGVLQQRGPGFQAP